MRLTARGRRAAVLVAVLTLGVVLLAGRAAAADDSGPLRVEVYTVATGDTLWQIASRVTTPGEDIRDVVIRLEELNRMSSVDLWAGEQILIPALG
ncbi:MAG: LysM peptidoglycan-binding domain-containing protein [Cellulomonas sp.]